MPFLTKCCCNTCSPPVISIASFTQTTSWAKIGECCWESTYTRASGPVSNHSSQTVSEMDYKMETELVGRCDLGTNYFGPCVALDTASLVGTSKRRGHLIETYSLIATVTQKTTIKVKVSLVKVLGIDYYFFEVSELVDILVKDRKKSSKDFTTSYVSGADWTPIGIANHSYSAPNYVDTIVDTNPSNRVGELLRACAMVSAESLSSETPTSVNVSTLSDDLPTSDGEACFVGTQRPFVISKTFSAACPTLSIDTISCTSSGTKDLINTPAVFPFGLTDVREFGRSVNSGAKDFPPKETYRCARNYCSTSGGLRYHQVATILNEECTGANGTAVLEIGIAYTLQVTK